MVTLPKRFEATKFPGYFWDTQEKALYSLKISGILKPLKHKKILMTMSKHGHVQPLITRGSSRMGGYRVSHEGRQRSLTDEYLYKLTHTDLVIPETKFRTRWVANREKIVVQQSLDFE